MSVGEKKIRDAILQTFNTGSAEYLEVAYNKSCVTTGEFYRVFRNTIADFKFLESPLNFIKSLLEFWDKHGLDSGVLEDVYNKWLDYEWFLLIPDVEYRFFWKWMFENGMKKFDMSYILENSDVKFKDVIERIASRNEYIDLVFNKKLDNFLSSVWEATLVTSELSIEEAISTIVYQFPNYEVRILNHSYHYIIKNFAGFSKASEMLLYVIERMADYEYYREKPIFSEGESCVPKNDDGNVNLNAEVEKIIAKCCDSMQLRDIAWILENRFNIDSEYIEECMCKRFVELCSERDLKSIVIGRGCELWEHRPILPIMVQFAAGYRIFLLFFEDLAKEAYNQELGMLEEKYGMNIEMNVKL
ncbi:MAG: hypothetical protein J6B87_00830 [Clostridia bacterium]|nr:hypothetical protein [Clostridia bacterium]